VCYGLVPKCRGSKVPKCAVTIIIHTSDGGPLELIVDCFANETVVVRARFTLAVTDSVNYTTVTLST